MGACLSHKPYFPNMTMDITCVLDDTVGPDEGELQDSDYRTNSGEALHAIVRYFIQGMKKNYKNGVQIYSFILKRLR